MSSVTATDSFNNITSSIILSFLNTTTSSSLPSTLIANQVNGTVDEINNKITNSSTPPTLSQTWITQLINNNDSIMPIECSMLMNQSDHLSLMLNDTNQNNILDQFNNQSQQLLNTTWLDMPGQSSLVQPEEAEIYCNAAWDGLGCWPITNPGTILIRSCKDVFNSVGELPKDHIDDSSFDNAFAYRICDHNGTWINNWTNYTECLLLIANDESDDDVSQYQTIRQLVIFIMFTCSILSLILLSITLFIFIYFRSLTSCRLRVHKNLVFALIIHSFLLLLIASPHLFNPDQSLSSYWEIEWLCKSILTLKLYSTLASINWMFIEGFQLHGRVTVSILRKDAPFRLYHLFGWGIPLILVVAWAIQMSLTMDTVCWNGYANSIYIWIIVGPMIFALLINCIFLVNIIRVLLTKLRLTVSVEIRQIRKAFKATVLLFPLLGISHLLFCINPDDNGRLEDAYLIFNAFLQSSQGIFVSILYCFMDTDVQQALKTIYYKNVNRKKLKNNVLASYSVRGERKELRVPKMEKNLSSLHLNNANKKEWNREKKITAENFLNIEVHTNNENDNDRKKSISNNNVDNVMPVVGYRKSILWRSLGNSIDSSPIHGINTKNLNNAHKRTISTKNELTWNDNIAKKRSNSKSTKCLCIMYNSNGEMVRFNPKLPTSGEK